MNERLLLIAREPAFSALKAPLDRSGYLVDGSSRGDDAIRSVDRLQPDVAIVDLALSGEVDGVDAAAAIGGFGVPVICLADTEDDASLERVALLRPAGLVAQPVDDRQLRLTVRAALARRAKVRTQPLEAQLIAEDVSTLAARHGIELTENLFDCLSDAVLVTSLKGEVLYENQSARKLLGEPGEAGAANPTTCEILGPGEPGHMPLADLPLLLGDTSRCGDHLDLHIRRPDEEGGGTFLSLQARPLIDAEGVPVGVVTVLHDITASKQAESDLRATALRCQERNDLMQKIFDSISDGLVAVDEKRDYLLFNRTAKEILGQHLDDAVPPPERSEAPGVFLPDETTPYPLEDLPLTRTLRNESTDDVEVFVRTEQRPEGMHLSVSGRPLKDDEGKPAGGTVVFRDVTEIRRARLELQRTARLLHEQRQTMDAAFEGISDGVLVFDTEGKLILANESAHRIVGRGMLARTDPSRWQDGHGIFFPDMTTRVPMDQFPHLRAARGESTDNMRVYIRNPRIPDGVHLSLDCRPMRDPTGKVSGAVMVAHDETPSHRADQALTNAFAHGRLEVLDTIVHNIGNAINSVSVGISTLREQAGDSVLLQRLGALATALESHREDWQSYLLHDEQGQQVLPFVLALAKDFERQNEELEQTIERVAARVNHIVEIVRTQTSQHGGAVTRVDMHLDEAIHDACGILHDSIERRGIKLHVDCTRAPTEIRVQESSFHQLIVNLTKNAVDAIDEAGRQREDAPPGEIHITAYTEGEQVVIEVADNGIGIAPEDLRHIFLPGYTTKATGTGLGLHSAANYVISSGGTIKPSSAGVGQGTTIRVAWRTATVSPGGTQP